MLFVCFQIQLTPEDGDPDGVLDFTNVTDPDEVAKMMERYREAQMRIVRKNHVMRDRLIKLVLEAEQLGII